VLLLVSLALPGLALLQDAWGRPEDRAARSLVPEALGTVAGLWLVAALGAVPAARDGRRRRAA